MLTTPAAAHGDEHGSATSWTFDPWVVVPLAAFGLLYGVGAIRLASRSRRPARLQLRGLMGWVGLLTLAGALISPLHWLGEHLFTFHMIEHEIVMAISAPLIVLARPVAVLLWGLPQSLRHVVGSVIRSPLVRRPWNWSTDATTATFIHGAAIWAWHVPVLFDAAVTNQLLHRTQHLSFFAAAILFWWAIFWKSEHGAAAGHLFVTMVHTSVLGALMALAPRVLFLAQTQAAMDWGLSPLEDQQLAGMVMWVPAGTIYAAATMMMLALWIRSASTRRAQNA
jgi:cytochrome c oxidase assembly factor CtaG